MPFSFKSIDSRSVVARSLKSRNWKNRYLHPSSLRGPSSTASTLTPRTKQFLKPTRISFTIARVIPSAGRTADLFSPFLSSHHHRLLSILQRAPNHVSQSEESLVIHHRRSIRSKALVHLQSNRRLWLPVNPVTTIQPMIESDLMPPFQ